MNRQGFCCDMVAFMDSDSNLPAEKRAIRLRIGRARRRIDRRLRAIEREGRRVVSWRTWLGWPPAQSLLASLGFGLAASGRLRPKRWMQVLGRYLARRAKDPALAAAFRQLTALWGHSGRKDDTAPPASDGGEHG